MKKSDGMSKSTQVERFSEGFVVWEQRHAPRGPCVPEAHAGARAESLQERLSRVVLRDALGWGLSRGILGRCLKDRASQGPSFGAHVLPAPGESGGDELLVPVFGLSEVVSRAHSLD